MLDSNIKLSSHIHARFYLRFSNSSLGSGAWISRSQSKLSNITSRRLCRGEGVADLGDVQVPQPGQVGGGVGGRPPRHPPPEHHHSGPSPSRERSHRTALSLRQSAADPASSLPTKAATSRLDAPLVEESSKPEACFDCPVAQKVQAIAQPT